MTAQPGPARATALQADLHRAAGALILVLQRVDPDRWTQIPGPAVWSIGKDAEHVAEAALYHQWIVRRTIGSAASSRRPAIERRELTTAMTATQAVDLILQRSEESGALIASLDDDQLALPTRPPRARAQALADTIDRVLIGHYDAHRRAIERKLSDGS
jgi:DinB superfamily